MSKLAHFPYNNQYFRRSRRVTRSCLERLSPNSYWAVLSANGGPMSTSPPATRARHRRHRRRNAATPTPTRTPTHCPTPTRTRHPAIRPCPPRPAAVVATTAATSPPPDRPTCRTARATSTSTAPRVLSIGTRVTTPKRLLSKIL